MYVNKGDDKIKQLHADIGRTIPKEDLKLGQKMKGGDRDRLYNVAKGGKIKKKKYSYRRGGMTTLRKPKRG